MRKQWTACCHYPTTVVLVDDNRKFHNSIKLSLERKRANYRFYDNPNTALQFLKHEYKPNPFTNRCLLRPEEQHKDHRNIEIDIFIIHQEIHNPKRFDEISVVVVDFAMPGINGLEFCQQLNDSNFKIILLTGEADEKIATELFNNGLIHKFLQKDAPHFIEKLNNAIYELQQEYFKDLSEIVINSLTKNSEHPPSCLEAPVFIDFFDKFCQQHQFIEYYLLEATGSYLLLDEDANPSLLVVKDEEEMEGADYDAEMSDTEVPSVIYEALKTRKMLLHRYTEEDYLKQPAQWQSLLHPAKKLGERTTYYYAYIDDPKRCPIDLAQVVSYKTYLNKF